MKKKKGEATNEIIKKSIKRWRTERSRLDYSDYLFPLQVRPVETYTHSLCSNTIRHRRRRVFSLCIRFFFYCFASSRPSFCLRDFLVRVETVLQFCWRGSNVGHRMLPHIYFVSSRWWFKSVSQVQKQQQQQHLTATARWEKKKTKHNITTHRN